jgi:hypothetical protein
MVVSSMGVLIAEDQDLLRAALAELVDGAARLDLTPRASSQPSPSYDGTPELKTVKDSDRRFATAPDPDEGIGNAGNPTGGL